MPYDWSKQNICFTSVYLFVILKFNLFTNGEIKSKPIYCCNRYKLIGKEKDLCKMIEIELNQTLTLNCHYCNEKDDGSRKIWTRLNKLENSPYEIPIIMEEKKFHFKDHSLTIRNVEVNDSGFYNCKSLLPDENTQQTFHYYIDVVNSTKMPEKGNIDGWKNYVEKYLTQMTSVFLNCNNEDYVTLREKLGVDIVVVGEWDSRQPCDGCRGIVERKVFCRLKPSDNRKMDAHNATQKMLKEKEFLSIYQLSCYSIQFSQLFPQIGNTLYDIPSYIIVNHCKGPCSNPSASKRGPKYHNVYKLQENSYLTLTCPEATTENEVVWKRNGKKIMENLPDPKVEVDMFGTLFLNGVTTKEGGNYTCYVDGIYMGQVDIEIINISIFHSKEFFWQNFYFFIIVWANFIFFCAILTIKWQKRSSYKNLDEILQDEPKRMKEFETILKKIH